MCFVLFSRARSLRAIYARFPCVLFVMELGVQNRRLLAFRQARESLILGKTSDVAGAAVNLKEAVVDTVLELVASKVGGEAGEVALATGQVSVKDLLCHVTLGLAPGVQEALAATARGSLLHEFIKVRRCPIGSKETIA